MSEFDARVNNARAAVAHLKALKIKEVSVLLLSVLGQAEQAELIGVEVTLEDGTEMSLQMSEHHAKLLAEVAAGRQSYIDARVEEDVLVIGATQPIIRSIAQLRARVNWIARPRVE